MNINSAIKGSEHARIFRIDVQDARHRVSVRHTPSASVDCMPSSEDAIDKCHPAVRDDSDRRNRQRATGSPALEDFQKSGFRPEARRQFDAWSRTCWSIRPERIRGTIVYGWIRSHRNHALLK